MNRSDFRKLYAYSDRCWHFLGETLTANPTAWDASFQTTSQWNTIRLLLAHSIAAEERLISFRLQSLALLQSYEERAAASWDGLYKDHQAIRTATYAYLDSLSDKEIEEETPVLPAIGGGGALTRSDVLFHILNHENYHRGQVITTLQRMGIDPPNFDYVLLSGSAP
jgi:uncharacterized damage-inducible protein DinB